MPINSKNRKHMIELLIKVSEPLAWAAETSQQAYNGAFSDAAARVDVVRDYCDKAYKALCELRSFLSTHAWDDDKTGLPAEICGVENES